jgi:hypothetical protein
VSASPARSRRRLGALALGFVVALLGTELALRSALPPEYFLETRVDAYWTARFRAQSALCEDLEFDSTLGWRMRRNLRNDDVMHDERGFRVTPGTASPDGTQQGTIVLLGDSFTYGLGVRNEDTYGARLAARLPGWTVINTAANGYGLDQQLLMWETEAAALQPRIVVVGYFVEDFLRNGLSFRDYAKPHFALDGDGLRLEGVPVPPLSEVQARLDETPSTEPQVLAVLRSGWKRVARKLGRVESPESFDARRTLSDRLLARLAGSVQRIDATLVVLVIPHRAYQGFPESRRIEEAIAAGCSAAGIDCINLTESCLQAEACGLPVYGDNGHFTATGHELVAGVLVEHLQELGRLD